jgi:D-proline reductase (dithiol) PrdB
MRFRQRVDTLLAKAFAGAPLLGRVWGKLADIKKETAVPWTPIHKPLRQCRVCLVTTGGLHLRTDKPFSMDDPEGDPAYRVIPSDAHGKDLTITHNYYDHKDADRDFNIILPLDRLRELAAMGHVGGMTRNHFSFMGHIDGPHVASLRDKILPRLLADLDTEKPDFVFLTPA